MKFLLVSDNHGQVAPLKALVEKYPQQDFYLHAGDSELSPAQLVPYQVVAGNNDYYYDFPNYLIITKDNIRILLIHGHQVYSFDRVKKLVEQAKQLNCQIVCFGHTHRPFEQLIDDVLVLNPGSLRYNRDGTPISYMLVDYQSKDQYQVALKRY